MRPGSTPNQFDQLRKLLAWKRHEQPPPGYFDQLPGLILSRLRQRPAPGRTARWWEDIAAYRRWQQRVWSLLEARPGVVGVFGVLGCALVLSAILYAERAFHPPAPAPSVAEPASLFPPIPAPLLSAAEPPVAPAFWASTNPLPNSKLPGALFDRVLVPPALTGFTPQR